MTASDWVGYIEHKTPEMLWNFTANTGAGNCTIFAEMIRDEQGIDLMGLPWCCTFVCAVCDVGRACAGVVTLARRMWLKGLWRGRRYRPKGGDIIFFKQRDRIDHIGIVETVTEEEVTVISGNTYEEGRNFEDGGVVARMVYGRSDKRIVGYAAIGKGETQ